MTMADTIAVMNSGRIEQLGSPADLYERPRTAFVAGFLGVSNLLSGVVSGDDVVRLESGADVRVAPGALRGQTGRIAVGVRPEKIRIGEGGANALPGVVSEASYVGVSSQYVVTTGAGPVTVFAQNADPGVQPTSVGSSVTLSWSPEATFVVDLVQEEGER